MGKPIKGTSTLKLVCLDSTDGVPHYGQRITFEVSTDVTEYPYVSVACYKGETQVLSASAGYYPSYAWPDARIVPLATQVWTEGAAHAHATLYHVQRGKVVSLATIEFEVLA